MPEPRAVLITRPAAEAASTAERVRQIGLVPVIASCIEIRQLRPRLPAGAAAILVTSGNALPALEPGGTTLLAVGDATAGRARALGFTAVLSAGKDAAALAVLASERLDPRDGSLLLACGAGQAGGLATDLRARGFRVRRAVCYEAGPVRRFPEPAASALLGGEVRSAMFLSAETAAAFVRRLPRPLRSALCNVTAVAIGMAAADALKPLSWRETRIAPRPTLDDVLALL